MKKFYLILAFLVAFFIVFSCETTLGPNELGGNTDLELTKVGNEFGISLSLNGMYNQALSNLKDSIFIIKNNGGIVTFKGIFTIDENSLKKIDTLLGTQNCPKVLKEPFLITTKKNMESPSTLRINKNLWQKFN